MKYSVEPYLEDESVWEVLEDSLPVFWGTREECQQYVNNQTNNEL
jgi:hypothetical protein